MSSGQRVDGRRPADGPIREDLPYRPIGPTTRAKAQVATTLMNAHAAGTVPATIGQASDFYRPRVHQSKVGEAWHIPSAETVTTRRFIEMVFEQIQRPARPQTLPKFMISMLGVFLPLLRAAKETLY